MRTSSDVEAFSRRVKVQSVSKCRCCNGSNPDCKCRKEAFRLTKLYEACVPRDFWDLTFKDIRFNREALLEIMRNYVAKLDKAFHHGYGLFLSGDNGVGKTTFISLILKAAVKKGYSVYYTTLPDLIYNISQGNRNRDISDRVNWYLTSDFVAIDEVGKDHTKNAFYNTEFHFERILKSRFDGSKPTLLASNLTLMEINDSYGKTVHSVINGKNYPVGMAEGDFRNELRKRMHDVMGYGK